MNKLIFFNIYILCMLLLIFWFMCNLFEVFNNVYTYIIFLNVIMMIKYLNYIIVLFIRK